MIVLKSGLFFIYCFDLQRMLTKLTLCISLERYILHKVKPYFFFSFFVLDWLISSLFIIVVSWNILKTSLAFSQQVWEGFLSRGDRRNFHEEKQPFSLNLF